MKKILFAGLVAVSVMSLAHQPASAWVNSKFGVGLNWELQSGGNNVLWGAWRNGQPPGPEAFGGPGYGGPAFAPAMPQPYHGSAPQGYPQQGFAPMPQPAAMAQQAPYDARAFEPAQTSPYQFATYPRPVYYQPSYYYYPSYDYYYYGR